VHFVSEIWVSLKPANLIIFAFSAHAAGRANSQSLAGGGFSTVGGDERKI
jgi:hypothetical protein